MRRALDLGTRARAFPSVWSQNQNRSCWWCSVAHSYLSLCGNKRAACKFTHWPEPSPHTLSPRFSRYCLPPTYIEKTFIYRETDLDSRNRIPGEAKRLERKDTEIRVIFKRQLFDKGASPATIYILVNFTNWLKKKRLPIIIASNWLVRVLLLGENK